MKLILLTLVILFGFFVKPLACFGQEGQLLLRALEHLFEEDASLATRDLEATYVSKVVEANTSHFGSAYSPSSSVYKTSAASRDADLSFAIKMTPSAIYANPDKYGVSMIGLNNSMTTTNRVRRIYNINGNLFALNNDHLSDVFSILIEKDEIKLSAESYSTSIQPYQIDQQLTKSIRAFQTSNNLNPTGKVNPVTYQKFVKFYVQDYAVKNSIISSASLNGLDNRLNILAYQKINKLPASGTLDQKTNTFIFNKIINDCKKTSILSAVNPDYNFQYNGILTSFGTFESGPNFGNYEYINRKNNSYVYSYDGNTQWSKISNESTVIILDELYHAKYIQANKVIAQKDLYKALYKYKLDHQLSINRGMKTWLNDQKEFKDISNLLADRSNQIIDSKRLINIIDGTHFDENDILSSDFIDHLKTHYPNTSDIIRQNVRIELLEKLHLEYYKRLFDDPIRSSINDIDQFLEYQYNAQDKQWVGYYPVNPNESYYIITDPLLNDLLIILKKSGSNYELVTDNESILKTYSRILSEKINSYSINDRAFVYIDPILTDDNKIVLSCAGENLEVPLIDLINLTSSKSCSSTTRNAFNSFSHDFQNKKMVLYNSSASLLWSNQKLAQNKLLSNFNFQLDDALLYKLLRQNTSVKELYLGKDLKNSSISIPEQKIGVQNYRLIVPNQTMTITDFGVNNLLKKTLDPNKIVQDVNQPIDGDVVLTVGHKDISYLNFIKQISDRNCFKHKIWISYSCYEPGDPLLASTTIRDAQAKAVIYFGDRIHPFAAQKLIKNFHQLNENSEQDFMNSLKSAIEKTIKENKILESELRKFERSLIIQISFEYKYLKPSSIS